MTRKIITIQSDADFAAFCKTANTEPVRVEFGINRITLPPTGLVLRGFRDVEFSGHTAPLGRLLMTGGRLTLLSCRDITLGKIGFRSQRLAKPLPAGVLETYERSWKPLAIHGETPATPSRNITLRECSLSGHTDEIEAGPADHAWWFANHIGSPAVISLTFDRVLFGPSFINTGHLIADEAKRAAFLAERQFHNMSISAVCCEDVAFVGSVFCCSNRREPQLAAKRVGLAHCVVDDCGTMCVGLHAGSEVEINACHFIRGPHTHPKERPVSFVEGTWQTEFAKLGPVSLAITPNCTEYNAAFTPYRKGWDLWQEAPSPNWSKKASGGVLPLKSISEIVQAAGCGDSLDVALRAKLINKQHVPWLENYSNDFPFPKVN